MIHKKNNVCITIAAREYLLRLGVISLIRHLGFEPEYYEAEEIIVFDKKNAKSKPFLIVHHDLIVNLESNDIDEIESNYDGKILVVESEITNDYNLKHIILKSDSEKIVVEKFQDFFSSFNPEENINDNNILSSREIDVLKEVARGYSNKEIADRLFISINTVITHRKNITEKLGIKTISGLTVYALLNKLIDAADVTF